MCAAAVLAHALIDIDSQYPQVSAERREQLLIVKGELEAQAPDGAPADPVRGQAGQEGKEKGASQRSPDEVAAALDHPPPGEAHRGRRRQDQRREKSTIGGRGYRG
jgi:hypothetical protein